MEDWDLLQAYAHQGSETAFRQLVERYIGLVHSMAMREIGNAHGAQDVTQAVFLILVRKAGTLSRETVLPGWLFKATRHVARTAMRGERRRQEREMRAVEYSENEAGESAISHVEAHLDGALESLGDRDRNALLLRYFQQRTVPEVAASLGVSEEAAQKRIERAVEKLRRLLGHRRVAVPAAAVLGVVSARAAQPVPPQLVQSVGSMGVPSAPAVSTTVASLMQEAMTSMVLSKLVALGVTAAAVLLFVVPTIAFLARATPEARKDYVLSDDFSLAANPDGSWSYGWQSNLTSSLNLFPVRGTTVGENGVPIDYWQSVPMNEPTIYHNATTITATSDRGNGVFPPGAVWISSGPNGSGRNFGVIRFTAPRDGNFLVDVSVSPYLKASRQGDADFHVLRNGVEVFARNLAPGESAVHRDTIALSAGNRVDFVVGRGADDDNYASALKIAIHIK